MLLLLSHFQVQYQIRACIPESHTQTHRGQAVKHCDTDKLPSQHPHRTHTGRGTERQVPSSCGLLPQVPQNHRLPDTAAQTQGPSAFQLFEVEGCQLITPHRHPLTSAHSFTVLGKAQSGAGSRYSCCDLWSHSSHWYPALQSQWSPSSWFSGQMCFPRSG